MEAMILIVALGFLGLTLITGGNVVETYDNATEQAGGDAITKGCGSRMMVVGLILALPLLLWVAGIVTAAMVAGE